MKKYYVGICLESWEYEIFQSEKEPTREEYGQQYKLVIGPFRTRRGARYMVAHPLTPCVDDAERLSKISK